jgi:hypothetical protein
MTTQVKTLTHDWCMKDEDFLKRIDECGGWPVGFRFVSFYHQVESNGRPCEFSNDYRRDGWWTTIATADDYYRWKLSPEAMKKIENEVRRKVAGEII